MTSKLFTRTFTNGGLDSFIIDGTNFTGKWRINSRHLPSNTADIDGDQIENNDPLLLEKKLFRFNVPLHDPKCDACSDIILTTFKMGKNMEAIGPKVDHKLDAFDAMHLFDENDVVRDARYKCVITGIFSLSKEKYIPRSTLSSINIKSTR